MTGSKLVLLVLLAFSGFIAIVDARALIAKKVIHAINAGSHMTKKTSQGFAFSRDQYYDEETNAVDYGNDANLQDVVIKYAKDQSIYMTERHGYNSFSYSLPVENEGTYTIILKFCEMYFDKPGRRVFNIKLGDQRVVSNLDVFARAGKFVAYDEYIEFKYINGKVAFKNQHCQNAIVDGKLILTFEKTAADNPIIQGIVLYAGGLDQTDYEDLPSFKANWEKAFQTEQRKMQDQHSKLKDSMLKKKEKIIVRNDHQELEDDYEEAQPAQNAPQQVATPRLSIKELLTSPIGAGCFLAGFFAAFWVLSQLILGQPISRSKQE